MLCDQRGDVGEVGSAGTAAEHLQGAGEDAGGVAHRDADAAISKIKSQVAHPLSHVNVDADAPPNQGSQRAGTL